MSLLKNPHLPRRHFLQASTAALMMAPALAKADDEAQTFNIEAIIAPRRIGDDSAPIKIIEFFSMTCSHCGAFHRQTYPQIKENLIDTGKVQFEMHPLPLDNLALRAHVMCRLLPNKGYFAMTDLLLNEQSQWVRAADPLAALMAYGRKAGITEDKFNAVMRSRPVLEAVVKLSRDEADKWKINATPSFVINEDKVISGGRNYEEFLSELDAFGV